LDREQFSSGTFLKIIEGESIKNSRRRKINTFPSSSFVVNWPRASASDSIANTIKKGEGAGEHTEKRS
jgi:hypothetical protein